MFVSELSDGEVVISEFFNAVALIGYKRFDPVVGKPLGLVVSCRLGVCKLGPWANNFLLELILLELCIYCFVCLDVC